MDVLRTLKYYLSGTPRVTKTGNAIRFNASHRLPSSGYEQHTAVKLIGYFGAASSLIAYYGPETSADPTRNILLEHADRLVAAFATAFDRLAAVAQQQTLDVPLESLQGWGVALLFLGGASVFRHSGLIDVFTYLTNREHVVIYVDEEYLVFRRGLLRSPVLIARKNIQDILIHANHRSGHDVVVQHNGGLTRVASIYGDLTRPTLFKLRLTEALAESRREQSTAFKQILRQLN